MVMATDDQGMGYCPQCSLTLEEVAAAKNHAKQGNNVKLNDMPVACAPLHARQSPRESIAGGHRQV